VKLFSGVKSLNRSPRGSAVSYVLDDAIYLVKKDGSLWTWGVYDIKYSFVDYQTVNKDWAVKKPKKIMTDVESVWSNSSSIFVLKKDNTLWGMGNVGSAKPILKKPKKIISVVKEFINGGTIFFVVRNDETLWAWGANGAGQVGNNSTTNVSKPTKILDNIRSVVNNGSTVYAIKTDKSIWAWGNNSDCQVGNGTEKFVTQPVQIMEDVKSFYEGETVWVQTSNNALYYWGKYGGENVPTPQKMLDNIKLFKPGYPKDYAITTDGSLYELTQDSVILYGAPLPLKKLSNVKSVYFYNEKIPAKQTFLSATGNLTSPSGSSWSGNLTFAICTDDSLWSWGDNLFGMLGNGTTVSSSEPQQILSDVKEVNVPDSIYNGLSVMALKNNGELWMWGENGIGHYLGDGTETDRYSPVKIMTDVQRFSYSIRSDGWSNGHSQISGIRGVVKTDGSLWTWGGAAIYLDEGRLVVSTTPKEVKFILPKATSITKLSAGKRKILVKWKKIEGTTKYEVRYKAKGTSGWTTKSVTGKSTSLKINKLTKNRVYQVQVRTCRTVSKVTHYSDWSKTITSKKV
jgi:alpha-tubulin suppressor-like RCC1 family protein